MGLDMQPTVINLIDIKRHNFFINEIIDKQMYALCFTFESPILLKKVGNKKHKKQCIFENISFVMVYS